MQSRTIIHWTGATLLSVVSSCVSPPIDGGPSADERLTSLLNHADSLSPRQLEGQVRALSLDHPRHVPALLADAALSMEAGRDRRAISLLDAVLRIEPANVDAVLLATRHATQSGNLAGAERRIKVALDQRPDEPRLYESYAAVLFVDQRYDESLVALEQADALAGFTSWRSYYHQGLVAEALNDSGRASELFAQCLELAPDYEPARRRRRALEVLVGTK